ncbi:MAG: universal stress protein [Alphaproteobacteria bacterium]|nr:universal stress protein [Alphaproteobacteria bacterium]MBF0251106.1 universal stress protein [Alphaproteobacteria bacterium]
MIETLSPMGHVRKVLLASDGSAFTSGARRVALATAKAAGAKLYAMTMVYVNPEYAALAPEVVHKAEQEAWWHLKSVGARADELGVEHELLVINGEDPSHEIVEQARALGADVIVVGQQGRRGLARLMVGDATAKVIGQSPCPVIVAPKDAEMWDKRVLVGVDGSQFSDKAAVAASNLAKASGKPVAVVSALVPAHSEARRQESRDAVDRTVNALRDVGLEATGLTAEGEADRVIVRTAEEQDADLIVLGAFGRTGYGRAVLGSVTERVIGNAHCPVLVVI